MFDIALAPGAEVGLPQALVAFMREYLYGSWAAGGLELPQDDGTWDALATGGHFSCVAAEGPRPMCASQLTSLPW